MHTTSSPKWRQQATPSTCGLESVYHPPQRAPFFPVHSAVPLHALQQKTAPNPTPACATRQWTSLNLALALFSFCLLRARLLSTVVPTLSTPHPSPLISHCAANQLLAHPPPPAWYDSGNDRSIANSRFRPVFIWLDPGTFTCWPSQQHPKNSPLLASFMNPIYLSTSPASAFPLHNGPH